MNPNVSNVINPKSLEKQIKLYDSRLQILRDEVEELERLRAACQLLLGAPSPVEATAESTDLAKQGKGKKSAGKDAKGTEEGVCIEEGFTPEPTVEGPAAEM